MPYTYTHYNVDSSPPVKFECDLQCERCSALRLDGIPCKRNVCVGLPFCYQHSEKILGVFVGKSRVIPGTLGLFAAKDFEKKDMVAPYGGEVISEEEVARRYGEGDLSLGPYLLFNVDAACKRSIASSSNGAFGIVPESAKNVTLERTAHKHGTLKGRGDKYQNLKITTDNLGIKYWSVASRRIGKGEEIVADYGGKRYDEVFLKRDEKCRERNLVCDSTRRTSKKKKK